MNLITVKNKELKLQNVQNVPEMQLYLADKPHIRRKISERFECWPFAWVGGQALARYIIDNPDVVKDKIVVDLASGSGIVGIAAKLAGAKRVICVDDYDPCIECIKINSTANNVEIETLQQDIFECNIEADLYLLGDPFLDVNALPKIKDKFAPTLVGCPDRLPHYITYRNNTIQTYEMKTKFDEHDEYDVHIWWIND